MKNIYTETSTIIEVSHKVMVEMIEAYDLQSPNGELSFSYDYFMELFDDDDDGAFSSNIEQIVKFLKDSDGRIDRITIYAD